MGPWAFSILAVLAGASAFSSQALAEEKVTLKAFASGFVAPMELKTIPGTTDTLVVDQAGVIYRVAKDGMVSSKPFLDLRPKMVAVKQGFDERGALGMALHPDFKQNRRFFVAYSAPLRKGGPEGWDHTMHISEFKALDARATGVEENSEKVILQIDKPAFNHNGGALAFGPDGYLYISVGDGGDAHDTGKGHGPNGNGQDTQVLLGKILRININSGNPYGIPKDNPFVSGGGRPEIFAHGLRNAWRMSFDMGGRRALFAADVGQTMYEEVNIIVKGGNYGWRVREGLLGFDPKKPNQPPADAPTMGADGKPFIDPAFGYKNKNGYRKDDDAYGTSITGGFVYRGKSIPSLAGRYIFADWSSNFGVADGIVLVATPPKSGSGMWDVKPLDLASHPGGKVKLFVVALGQDADGEVYVMTNGSNQVTGKTGKVWKLVKAE